MKKQLLLFLAAILPMMASADASGTWGENLTWTYVETTHTLTISGEGSMANCDNYGSYGYSRSPWYSYGEEMTKAIIEDGVTSIGDNTFFGCSGLTSITIPDGVTSIGSYAFFGCSGLTSITIPDGVTSIGSYAFSGCSGLTSITIPDGVTSIADNTFRYCSGLTSITIPNSVTSIGDDAFFGCSGLTSITIPDGVTSIGSDAFAFCSGLTSITIPNSVTSIGDDAFFSTAWCDNQPDGLVYAGKVAYMYIGTMPNNTKIVLEEGTTEIARRAFFGCSGLTSITIPNSVTSIGDDAFAECSGLTSIHISDLAWWCNMNFSNSRLFDNAYHLYLGDQEITNLVIPDGITTISSYSFKNCAYLTSITIPNSVTSIGNNAFTGCSSLTSIHISDLAWWCNTNFYNSRLLDNAHHLYLGDQEISNLVIPDGITTISSYSFKNCAYLTSITIPNSVTSIGYYAFDQCYGLTSVTLNCNEIGSWFSGNTSIQEVVIGKKVTAIGISAFSGCTGFVSIIIPSNVTFIGAQAFSGCNSLLTVNSEITEPFSCGTRCFSDYTLRKGTLYVPAGTKDLYARFDGWREFLKIQEKVPGEYFFEGTESDAQGVKYTADSEGLTCHVSGHENYYSTAIVIPEIYKGRRMMKIDNAAFSGCGSLTSIRIPMSVTSIGELAFNGCNNLTSVSVAWETPIVIGDNVFPSSICQNATLYVPKGTKALYEAANVWKGFGEIVEMDEITIGDEGMGTYCSTHALDFSGTDDIKAYIVSAFKPSTGEVTLTRITDVPANTGIVVKGAAGTYSIPMGFGETIVSNMLRGVTTNTVLNKVEGDNTNYVLAKKNGNLGFYAVVDGSTLSAGKAYLPLPTASLPSGARSIKLVFEDGETTGISDASQLNDNEEMINDNVYDLQGRRVEKPTRGLYVVNGRKVVIK